MKRERFLYLLALYHLSRRKHSATPTSFNYLRQIYTRLWLRRRQSMMKLARRCLLTRAAPKIDSTLSLIALCSTRTPTIIASPSWIRSMMNKYQRTIANALTTCAARYLPTTLMRTLSSYTQLFGVSPINLFGSFQEREEREVLPTM